MYNNRNFSVSEFRPERFSDGTVKEIPVDDFPVSDASLYNEQGWPMSDIGILDRFSREHRDRGEIEQIASRLEEISVDNVNIGKSDEQLLRELRPHWVQTAAEYQDYEVRLMQYLEQSTNTAEDGAVKTSDSVVSSEPVASTSSVSSSSSSSSSV